jgi:hypothetical protein
LMVPTACMNDAAGARGVGKRGNSGGVAIKTHKISWQRGTIGVVFNIVQYC